MPTVQHPAFENVTREISEAEVAEWVEQGWTLSSATDETADDSDETSK